VSIRLVLATRNAGKVVELQRILADLPGQDFDLVGMDELPGSIGDVVETGATFAENALLKARVIAGLTRLPAVADDSGLCVDALNGMPGVLSARWAGRHGDDQANLELLLGQLRDVPADRRAARFTCAAAAALPSGQHLVVEESLFGTLVREPRGAGGFGYDPIFVPEGETRTTAEMRPEEKDAISHRGKAFRALASQLPALLGT
jgi:XTP/dITP diphosphohydrolase